MERSHSPGTEYEFAAANRGALRASDELDNVPYKIDGALFPAAASLLEVRGSGAIDIVGIGGQPFAFAYASGAKIKVVYAARPIDGPDRGRSSAIIVPANSLAAPRRRSEGPPHCHDPRLGGQDLALLQRHGLKPSDVIWVHLNNVEGKSALETGKIDAWLAKGVFISHIHQRKPPRRLTPDRIAQANASDPRCARRLSI